MGNLRTASLSCTGLAVSAMACAHAGDKAVISDPDTTFHRLYIVGAGSWLERQAWEDDLGEITEELSKGENQADGSTSRILHQPSIDSLKATLAAMKELARPGDEITIYYTGHGYGGMRYGFKDHLPRTQDEPYDESIWLNDGDGSGEADKPEESILDDDFSKLFTGFADGVSISFVMDACYAGGFSGTKDDVQETTLVQLIGPYTQCPSDGPGEQTLTEDIVAGVSDADMDGDGVVTMLELKVFLNKKEWHLGQPFDSEEDLRFGSVLGYADSKKQGWKGRGRPENVYETSMEASGAPVSAVTREEIRDIPVRSARDYIGAGVAFGEVSARQTGIGFMRQPGGDEMFAGRTRDSADTEGYSLNLLLKHPQGSAKWDNSFGITYSSGSARDEFHVPAGAGYDTGFVYGDLSPSGSSGVNIGDSGLSGSTAFDYSSLSLKAKWLSLDPISRTIIRPYYFGEIRRNLQEWDLYGEYRFEYDYYDDYYEDYSVAYDGSQARAQSVTDEYYGGGAGLYTMIPVTDKLLASAYVSGAAYMHFSELDSMEWNSCSFCGPQDRQFAIDITEDETTMAFEALGGFILNYQLDENFGIALYGSAGYLTDAGGVYNPSSGDDVYYDGKSTALITDEQTRWRLGVASIVSFDEGD